MMNIHAEVSGPGIPSLRSHAAVDDDGLLVQISRKSFTDSSGKHREILRGVSFRVAPRERFCLVGPSGSGKTTLLRLIGGLDRDFEGRVLWNGSAVRTQAPASGILRTECGVVFQESRLLPWMTAEANVAFALPSAVEGPERKRRARAMLDLVGLDGAAALYPGQLSGGMSKRVAIARALVNRTELLLLDEPFSSLDLYSRMTLQEELVRLLEEQEVTAVLITHDVEEATFFGDRVGVLSGYPAHLHVHNIDLPIPRDRQSPDFLQVRNALLNEVLAALKTSKLAGAADRQRNVI